MKRVKIVYYKQVIEYADVVDSSIESYIMKIKNVFDGRLKAKNPDYGMNLHLHSIHVEEIKVDSNLEKLEKELFDEPEGPIQ